MKQTLLDNKTQKGIVTRRVYSGSRLKELLEKKTGLNFDASLDSRQVVNFDALCVMALDVISKDELKELLDKSAKKQFADNFLWRFIYKTFHKDIAIPFITGYYTTKAVKHNLITNTGFAGYAGQIGGTTSTAFTAMAYGTGTTAAAVTDTALQTEVGRAAATITRTTTSVTNDTTQWVHTFTAGGTQAITEEGLLDNNTSGGNLLAHNVFSAINMVSGDTLQFTHTIANS